LVLQTKYKSVIDGMYHHSHMLATMAVRGIIHTLKLLLANTATKITIFLLPNFL